MTRKISYRDAINEALVQEMERDPNVIVYGIDVADHKRIFGSTNHLSEKFGNKRCFSTPLCEDTLVGFGLGAALNGLRPVNVHMRVDFLLLAMNQLINMVSSFRYGSGGQTKVPLVIRAVIGKGWGQSYQHSKSLQSFFAHIPGLKVVMPTTPKDAKGLLVAAIRDDNPVIIIEHRFLYDVVDEVPNEPYEVPLSGSNLLRSGKDATVLATSWMNVEAVKAAEILSRRNVHLEIIDIKSISEFDEKLICDSVRKTGHCIIADYDWINCGFSAELATRVYDSCAKDLKSSVTRIGYKFTPCASTRPLEDEFYPNAIDIIKCLEAKLKLQPTDLSDEQFYTYENKFRGPF